MDIFGLSKAGLTNPLTEDLQGADFNIYDINELHINELHDQDGTGPIVVHESLNMTNKQISNMADPTQNKDAANKQYVDSIPTSIPYDIYVALSDETTSLSSGVLPVFFQAPRDMYFLEVIGYLSLPDGTATNLQFDLEFQNSTGSGPWNNLNTSPIVFTTNDLYSTTYSFGSTGSYRNANGRYRVNITQIDGASSATGFKLLIRGRQA